MESRTDLNWKKNVALFLLGQAVSLIGSSLVSFAIMWYVTLETQSGSIMSLFTAANLLPTFFIAPFGGVWADRYDRKLLINLADGAIAAVTLVIALLFSFGAENIVLLLVCSAVRSLGQGVQMPAVNALLPMITPAEHLVRVNGVNSTIQSISMLATPALAGALLAFAPIQSILYIDVVTAAIGISILFFLVKTPKRDTSEIIQATARGYKNDLELGISYMRTHRFIKRIFVCYALFCVLITPLAFLTPLQVARDFGADVWRLTAIEIAYSGGMLVGGVIISAWGGFKNRTVTCAIALLVEGALVVGLGLLPQFGVYVVCMATIGMVAPIKNAPVLAILQTKTDADFRGRVFSVMTMISAVAMPLAMFVFGPLGDHVPIAGLLIGTGIGAAALAFLILGDRTLRDAGLPETEAEPTLY